MSTRSWNVPNQAYWADQGRQYLQNHPDARTRGQTWMQEHPDARSEAQNRGQQFMEAHPDARAQGLARAQQYAEAHPATPTRRPAYLRGQQYLQAHPDARARGQAWVQAHPDARAQARARGQAWAQAHPDARARGQAWVQSTPDARAQARARGQQWWQGRPGYQSTPVEEIPVEQIAVEEAPAQQRPPFDPSMIQQRIQNRIQQGMPFTFDGSRRSNFRDMYPDAFNGNFRTNYPNAFDGSRRANFRDSRSAPIGFEGVDYAGYTPQYRLTNRPEAEKVQNKALFPEKINVDIGQYMGDSCQCAPCKTAMGSRIACEPCQPCQPCEPCQPCAPCGPCNTFQEPSSSYTIPVDYSTDIPIPYENHRRSSPLAASQRTVNAETLV